MSATDEAVLLLMLGLGALVAFPLLFALLALLGRLLNHLSGGRLGWLPVVLAFGGLVGLAFAGSFALDTLGEPVPAIVMGKEERIQVTSDGDWTHRLAVQVRYQGPDGEPRTPSLSADRDAYDRLSVGAIVTVIRLPQLASVARLEGQSLLSLVPWREGRGAAMIVGGIALALAFLKLRRGRLFLIPLAVAWLALPVQSYLESPIGPGADGPWLTGTAQVVAIERATRSWLSGRTRSYALDEPFEVAQLRFVPAGRGEPVMAAATADIGSVPGLAPGEAVATP
jgi:hypothetical protein